MKIIKSLLGLALLVTTLQAGAFSFDEDFPAPPSADVETLAGSVTSLGMNLQIRRFSTKKPMSAVQGFYRRLWEDDAHEVDMPPWTMIGARFDEHYYNVQMQSSSAGTWGYLSISDLPEKLDKRTLKAPSAKKFPHMNGSSIIDNQVSKDPGKTGRTVLLSNDFSVKSNHTFYRNYYKNKGWKIEMDEKTDRRSNAFALYATKGSESVTLTIHKQDGKTYVVGNHVTRGLLR